MTFDDAVEADDHEAEAEKLTPAQQAEAARHVGFALALARPHANAWPEQGPEFESDALFALMKGVLSFDAARAVPLREWIRLKINMAMRAVKRRAVAAGYRYAAGDDAPSLLPLDPAAEEVG